MASSEYKPHDIPCALCGHGEPSSHPSTGLCAVCLQQIERAHQIELVPDGTEQRRVALFPFTSETIARAGWRADGKTGVLVVQFKGGSTFHYANVTRLWWQSFLQAESKGRFFHRTVRADASAFPYRKIN